MFRDYRQYSYEERLDRLNKAHKQYLKQINRQRTKLHIVYVVGNPSICGANKIIYEQANHLMDIGMKVTVVAYGEKPKWLQVKANYIQVPYEYRLALWIPYCHVIIATYYTHIHECIERCIAPVIYFEQGDLHLFQYEEIDARQQQFITKQYNLVSFVMTVSQPTADLIKKYFGKTATVIPNAIDHSIFCLIGNCSANPIRQKRHCVPNMRAEAEKFLKDSKRYLLIIGRDDITFKGIKEIIGFYKVFNKVYKDIELYWITPYVADTSLIKHVSKVFVSPTQNEIGELMRHAIALISASYFESFSLPVLEAMACGCPVISADNLGVCTYGEDGENILLYQKSNLDELMSQCQKLLQNNALREKLIKGGIRTAERFQWKSTIKTLFDYLCDVSSYEVFPDDSKVGDCENMLQIYNYAKTFYDYGIYDEAIYFLDIYIQCEDEPLSLRLEASRLRYLSYYQKGDIPNSRYYCFQTFELTVPNRKECEFIANTFLDEERSNEAEFWNFITRKTI